MKLMFSRTNWRLIRKNLNSTISYEIHIEPEEYVNTRQYYVFVGFELKKISEVPLEMFIKILPSIQYLKFTAKAKDHDSGEYYFKNWFSHSKYEQAYPYIIQAYDAQRFKSLEDEESEIDWYIPIKDKSESDPIY